ncbi:hypothetical protein ACA910_011629 [Epithemia clementina (nom. ined.)]
MSNSDFDFGGNGSKDSRNESSEAEDVSDEDKHSINDSSKLVPELPGKTNDQHTSIVEEGTIYKKSNNENSNNTSIAQGGTGNNETAMTKIYSQESQAKSLDDADNEAKTNEEAKINQEEDPSSHEESLHESDDEEKDEADGQEKNESTKSSRSGTSFTIYKLSKKD